ncbi:hypothetical protein [Arthrobacter sp. UYEF3]
MASVQASIESGEWRSAVDRGEVDGAAANDDPSDPAAEGPR